MGMGLQLKSLDEVIKSLDLPVESALGQFNRALRRLLKAMTAIQEAALAKHLPKFNTEFVPVSISLHQDLEQAAEVCISNLYFSLNHFLHFWRNPVQNNFFSSPQWIISNTEEAHFGK